MLRFVSNYYWIQIQYSSDQSFDASVDINYTISRNSKIYWKRLQDIILYSRYYAFSSFGRTRNYNRWPKYNISVNEIYRSVDLMFRLSLNEYNHHLCRPPNAVLYYCGCCRSIAHSRNSESANSNGITNKTKYNNMYEYYSTYIFVPHYSKQLAEQWSHMGIIANWRGIKQNLPWFHDIFLPNSMPSFELLRISVIYPDTFRSDVWTTQIWNQLQTQT